LGLKGYTKELINVQTDAIWFEVENTGRNSRGDTAPVNFSPKFST
jgi:hypothetical protein